MLYTSDGDAIAGLGDIGGSSPTGFGTPELSGWQAGTAARPRVCKYTLLDKQLIPARTTLVIGVRVMPTNTSLPISNPQNLWTLSMSTSGDHASANAAQTF